MSRYDVIVVGGGVAGAATALGLAQAGFSVALLERGRRPRAFDIAAYDLRVYALAPGSTEFLRRLQVWPRIESARVSAYQAMRVWENHVQQPMTFSARDAGVAELGHIVESSLLLSALWAELRGLEVLPEAELEPVDIGSRGVSLTLRDGRALKASLVIAAEGADSALRAQAGIETEEYIYPQQAIVCHVQTAQPHHATAFQRFTPDGVLAFLPLADGRSSIVWSTTRAAGLLALEDGAFMRELTLASEHVLGEVTTTTSRVKFPLRLLHACDYVRERLALVGDAAHVIHPLAGQGVNLGLADAQALVEILAQAKQAGQDIGGLRVLKRYARARRADTLEMLALTDGLYRAFGPASAGWNEWRYAGMKAVNRWAPLKNYFVRRALQA